jgi:hypothetical protein
MPATNCVKAESDDALRSRITSLVAPSDVVLFKGVDRSLVFELNHQLSQHKLPAAA